MDFEAHHLVLIYGFLGAVALGALANRTNFCTMGAVSDWINMGKKGRLWAWFTAIAVAMAGVLALEATGVVSVNDTIPPYRTDNFAWLRYILGGFMFGIGMTLAGGCGNKTLLNIGGGNIKSVFVLLVAGLFAYLMTKTDFYGVVFHGWISATTVDLNRVGDIPSQEIAAVLTGTSGGMLHYGIGAVIIAAILVMALRDRNYRRHWTHPVGGIGVGLAVVGAWYTTGGPLGQEAMEAVMWMDQKPAGVGVQSYTFINPMGETLYYLADPANFLRITFGVVALAGIIVGSFLAALFARRLKLVWFNSRMDFVNHLVGGTLMGIGGVLAMGCSIGQGITGVSTLAVGSFMALGSIIFGSALTMKMQYYRMMYDEEATFAASLSSVLADLRLLPASLRQLDPP